MKKGHILAKWNLKDLPEYDKVKEKYLK